ncbi:hypothetical protein HHI36_022231 [Cryptolaemus montrouzieri]|uniref:ODAD1 central coiled coil region domain-containing protein n=1 Tax=Cryptolaemus montrouzieri TaxID=559131 RepID=A0ABD2MZ92_9CUCU
MGPIEMCIREEGRHEYFLWRVSNFNLIWEKLLETLSDGKKMMLNIIEEASSAYDQREEWCAKLHALKMKAKNDELLHTQDLREMQRIMDHDGKLREFLSVKGQKRIMKDLEIKEQTRRETLIKDEEKQVEVYENTLKQIQDFCQENNIDRIAAKYLKQEEENFALFNYVNELHHELENSNKELDALQIKLDEQKAASANDIKDQQASVKMIDEYLGQVKQEVQEAGEVLKGTEEKFKSILDGIFQIFNILECDHVPILELIGNNTSINSNNVSIYLSLIEKRVSELITIAFVTDSSVFCEEENLELENIS